jgi:hypothetical protein
MRLFLTALLALVGCCVSARAQTVLFTEDFESGYANWSMTGLWNAQDSTEPCTSFLAPFPSGTHAVWYGSSTTCSYLPSDGGNHYLTHLQPIVIPATSGVVELHFRSHSYAEDDGVWDLRQVEVSTNGGTTWTKAGDCFSLRPGWRSEVFDLTRFAGSTIQMRFRFWVGDPLFNDFLGWLVDDIEIVERDAAAIANCLGDGTWRDCPCNNQGASGRGCASSFNAAGAGLIATGMASVGADTLQFTADGMSAAAATILQSSTFLEAPFLNIGGDGWMCMRSPFARIRTLPAPGGAITYPLPGDVPISVRGGVPPAGGLRYYSVRYRNAANFCTASTFNVTNGLIVTWRP